MQHTNQFLHLVNKAKKQIKEMSVFEVSQFIQQNPEAMVIDVREAHEWQRGRVLGAFHLSKGVIERDIESVISDNNKPLVLYCGGGYRSALAALNVQQMGYKNVISMDGGFSAWMKAGLPIET